MNYEQPLSEYEQEITACQNFASDYKRGIKNLERMNEFYTPELIEAALAKLNRKLDRLAKTLKHNPEAVDYLPPKAVIKSLSK